jgi:hypothetical protein
MLAGVTSLRVLRLALAYTTKLIKTQSMEKEEIRSIMGELIRLQAIIKEMEKSGFQWEKLQEISDSLRLLIIDLENSLD